MRFIDHRVNVHFLSGAELLHRASGSPPHRDPLATLLEWLEQAQGLGAVVEEQPRLESFGAEAWLNDPEGNALLLLVPVQSAPSRG